jgi:hypothetical protein
LLRKIKCPGCRGRDANKTVSCLNCSIKNCPNLKHSPSGFCYDCGKFPCVRLKHLDTRYRTKYGMSMIENLENIRKSGTIKFVRDEKIRWMCLRCGAIVCVHTGSCVSCGKKK